MAMPLCTGLCACALHYPTRATQREPPEVKRRIFFFISSGIMSTDPPIETDPPAADPPAADPNSDIRAMIKSSLLEVLRENPTLLRPPVQQSRPGGDPPQDGEGSKSPRHHMAGSLAQPGGGIEPSCPQRTVVYSGSPLLAVVACPSKERCGDGFPHRGWSLSSSNSGAELGQVQAGPPVR